MSLIISEACSQHQQLVCQKLLAYMAGSGLHMTIPNSFQNASASILAHIYSGLGIVCMDGSMMQNSRKVCSVLFCDLEETYPDLSICLSICVCVCVFVHLSVHLCVCLSVCVSVMCCMGIPSNPYFLSVMCCMGIPSNPYFKTIQLRPSSSCFCL